MYDLVDYKGYAYIKIYEKNASRESMLDYLKNVTELTKTITFGSIEGKNEGKYLFILFLFACRRKWNIILK